MLSAVLNGVSELILAAGVFCLGRAIGINTRRLNRHYAEMTQIWTAHVRVASELADLAEVVRVVLAGDADDDETRLQLLSADVADLQAGTARLLSDLTAMTERLTDMERDVPGDSRDVPHIEYPGGSDPS